MVGLREEVDGLHFYKTEAAVAEDAQVTGQRGRLARHVDHLRGRVLYQSGERSGVAAGARRIEQYNVRSVRQLRQDVFDLALAELDVGRCRGVELTVAHGRPRLFDGQHVLHIGREEHRESAHAGVRVDDELIAGGRYVIPHQLAEPLRLGGVNLKERWRCHTEPVPEQLFVVMGLACLNLQRRVLDLGLD